MASGTSLLINVIRRIAASGLGDAQLLTRFADSHDENAFANLVLRHGPLVLHVCRQVLRDPADVEDAFQATFLVLVRRAGAVRKPERLAAWLYGVAYRVATRVRIRIARLRTREKSMDGLEEKASAPPSASPDEWFELHDEINRLPEKLRLPIVLCYLQGMTREQAARQLGWTDGAIKGCLERGRDLLRNRLLRHGGLFAGQLPAAIRGAELPPIPGPLLTSTVTAATRFATATTPTIVGISTSVLSMTKEVLTAMFIGKIAMPTASMLLLPCLLIPGAWMFDHYRTLAADGGRNAANPPVMLVQAKTAPAPVTPTEAPRPDSSVVRLDAPASAPLPKDAVARLGSTQLRHGESYICSMIFTPDGKTLISQSPGQTFAWEVATSRPLLEFSKNLLSANQHGISLSPDGKVLAAPGKAGMSLWDVATGKELQSIGTQRFVWICFSPDGKLLATQGGSQFVDCNLWDARSGDNVRAWTMTAGADFATPPLFTKDSKTLITAHRDKTVRFWDVATGQERDKLVLDWKDPRQLVLSPDGKIVAASGYQSENIHLIDVAEARERFRIAAPDRTDENGWKVRFTEIAFTPDGTSLVAAGIDRSLIFFDPATGKEQRRLEKEFNSVFCMALSPDGKTVASAIGGKLIRLTDLASGRDLIPTSGHWSGIWSATFAEGGKLVATVGGGNDVFIWDAVTGREVRRLKGHTAGVTSVALTLDGRLLRSVGTDKTTRYWDPSTGKQTRQTDGLGNGWGQTRSPDGRIVVMTKQTSSSKVSALSAVDSETGKELWSQDSDHSWYGSTFSGDGKTLVGWSGDRMIHLLDPHTGRQTKQYPIDAGGGGDAYYGVTLSNDGKVLACGSQRATLVIVEAATGKTLHNFKGLPDGVSAIAFSPDDKMLAWGGWRDPKIHLIELATGMERRIFPGTMGRVLNLSFSPDGKKLLSGSEDTTATVWDMTGRLGKPNLDPGKPATAAEMDALWDTLADGDAAKAYRAMQALADSPRITVLYLGKHIKSVPRESDQKLARLIADLDSGDFQTRDRATVELDKLGEAALGAYDATLAATPSLEARRRIEALKEKHDPWRPSPDRLRTMRALETLEMCGAEARDLLAILAQGAPGSYSADHARNALRRLAVP